jgi:GT2 family glycosyltransferase
MRMSKSEPRVSVVLINWNALQMTLNALATMYEHWRGTSWEAIVVDNGSTHGGNPDEIPARFPAVKLLKNSENLGFSAACNRGARLGRSEYLLLLNNDTLQTEDALSKAVEYMDANPEIGALGIKHVDPQGKWQASAFRFPRPVQDVLVFLGLGGLVEREPAYAEEQEAEVDWACGSFLLIRRSCWEAVGELDERFFVYDEDIDWCLHASSQGWKVGYWPATSMIHIGAASGATLRDKTFMHFRSRMTLYAKSQPLGWALAFYAATSLRLAASTLNQVALYARGRSTRAKVLERLQRQASFSTLRPSRAGIGRKAKPHASKP